MSSTILLMTASLEVAGGTAEGDGASVAAVAMHLECTGSLDKLHEFSTKVSSIQFRFTRERERMTAHRGERERENVRRTPVQRL